MKKSYYILIDHNLIQGRLELPETYSQFKVESKSYWIKNNKKLKS